MTDSATMLTPAQRRRSLTAIMLHMFGIGITIGVTTPLMSLILEGWQVQTWLTGLVVGMHAAAILLFMPFFPRVIGRLGTLSSIAFGCLIGVAAILLLPLFPSVAAWGALRFLLGVGLALPWLVGETWINIVALEKSRGRVIALYSVCIFTGFALGPLVVDLVGITGWTPYLVAAGALVLAIVPLGLAQGIAPPMPVDAELRTGQVMRAAPTVAAAAFVGGAVENAYYALFPIYALRSGLPQDMALQLLTSFLIGGLLLQFPLGWACDRVERHILLAGLGFAGAFGMWLLPFAMAAPILLAVLVFVLGGISIGFYSVGLTLLGQRFRPGDLAVANAAFIILYELGTFAGPGLAGAAMDLAPRQGFVAIIAGLTLLFGLMALARHRRRGRASLPPDDDALA